MPSGADLYLRSEGHPVFGLLPSRQQPPVGLAGR